MALAVVPIGEMGTHTPYLRSNDHASPVYPSNRTTTNSNKVRALCLRAPHKINDLVPNTVEQLHFRSNVELDHRIDVGSTLGAGLSQRFYLVPVGGTI